MWLRGLRGKDAAAPVATPVRIAVEQVILGQEGQSEIVVYALGGAVGSDKVVYESDDLYSFTPGDRVVVFVKDQSVRVAGAPKLTVVEKYSIIDGELATNKHRSIPLENLKRELVEAARSLNIVLAPALLSSP